MAVVVTHSTVVVTPDDGTSEVGSDEWNANHVVTGAAESATQVIAGAGLIGGGDLSADRTLNVGAGTGITVNANDVALDTAHARNVDHTVVTLTAGAGLTGGGDISANRTFTVGAGTGITVNTDDVALTIPVAVSSGGTGQTTEAEAVGELIQALSTATPDTSADYFAFWDATDDTGKKALLSTIVGGGGRTIISADTTFYVRTDGNDANDGLTNNSGGAWRHIAFATRNLAENYEFKDGARPTIQIADGTYDEDPIVLGALVTAPVDADVFGAAKIVGNTTTPRNVFVNVTNDSTNYFGCFSAFGGSSNWSIDGLKVEADAASTQYTSLLFSSIGALLNYDRLVLGETANGGAWFDCENNAQIFESGAASTIEVDGTSALAAFYGFVSSNIILFAGHTYKFTDDFSFTQAAVYAAGISVVEAASVNFDLNGNTVTGQRYFAELGGIINTGGGGASHFPGSIAGAVQTGGQYY